MTKVIASIHATDKNETVEIGFGSMPKDELYSLAIAEGYKRGLDPVVTEKGFMLMTGKVTVCTNGKQSIVVHLI